MAVVVRDLDSDRDAARLRIEHGPFAALAQHAADLQVWEADAHQTQSLLLRPLPVLPLPPRLQRRRFGRKAGRKAAAITASSNGGGRKVQRAADQHAVRS